MSYGLGVGSSGARALAFVDDALAHLRECDELHVLAVSDRYRSAPLGGGTDAPFVNAAVVVDTRLSGPALLRWLFSLERRFGRVRGARYGGRSLDLDVLWSAGPPLSRAELVVPHPRLKGRGFALVPLLEALRRAGLPAPIPLLLAAQRHGGETLGRLPPLSDSAD